MIYFDHAASTFVKIEAQDILIKSMQEDFANPSAAHKLGKSCLKKVDKARAKILKLLKAKKDDHLIFVGSATEANNMIIKGITLVDNSVVHFSKGDHPSTTNPCLEINAIKSEIKLNIDGSINEEILFSSINQSSKLVVLSHVNNQTGNLYPIVEIAKKIKNINSSVHIHIDGVQALTKVPVDLSYAIDSYTISGHKIGAPKGVGALFIKKDSKVEPLLHGGGHEFGLRASTINTPMILSLLSAIECGVKKLDSKSESVVKINELIRNKLNDGDLNISFPFPLNKTSPYILSFIFPGISSDVILRHLEMKDIFVASSSACSSRAKGFNAGFAAMNIDESLHKFVLRVSFSEENTTEEASEFVDQFVNVVKDIKKLL
jgi:cysteine desulfurase